MIKEDLINLSEEKYKQFHSSLMPEISNEKILGIRIPLLRNYAKKIYGTNEAENFLNALPHYYYEENNLHAFLIEQIRDYEECIQRTEEFLPFIDNWATCDSFRPKVFKKNKEKILKKAMKWIKSDHPFTCRYGIEILMLYFLDNDFDVEYPRVVSKIKSDHYYVKMMIAWYFATALTKQYNAVLPFIENKTLDTWTHNKAIQKAKESFRVPQENKEYLNSLKIK